MVVMVMIIVMNVCSMYMVMITPGDYDPTKQNKKAHEMQQFAGKKTKNQPHAMPQGIQKKKTTKKHRNTETQKQN